MRREVWIDDAIGNVTIVLSDGDEVKAIYWCDEDYETEIVERFKELDADPMAYFGWKSGYNNYTVWRASEIDHLDKYDEDGEEVDLKEHPWTLHELFEHMTDWSHKLNPLYVVAIDENGDETTAGRFYSEDNAKKFADGFSKAWKWGIEIRQYDKDIEDDNWDGCLDHTTIDWTRPLNIDGKKVRIVFDDGETADIFGEVTFAEENRIHIVIN